MTVMITDYGSFKIGRQMGGKNHYYANQNRQFTMEKGEGSSGLPVGGEGS